MKAENAVLLHHTNVGSRVAKLLRKQNVILSSSYAIGPQQLRPLQEREVEFETVINIKELNSDRNDAVTMFMSTSRWIPKEVRLLTTAGKDVYLIIEDTSVSDNYEGVFNETVDLMKIFKKSYKNYKANRDELTETEDNLSTLRQERKELRDIEDRTDLIKAQIADLTKEIEDLVSLTVSIREVGSELRRKSKVGLLLTQADPFANLFKIGRPVYFNKHFGLLVLKCSKASKKGSYNVDDLNEMIAVMDKTEDKKDWSAVKEKLEPFINPTTLTMKSGLSHGPSSFAALLSEEIEPLKIQRSISLSDTVPAAEVTAATMAQMFASGAMGNLDMSIQEDGETVFIKSAMVSTVTVDETIINGEKITSTIRGHAPKIGAFAMTSMTFTLYEI